MSAQPVSAVAPVPGARLQLSRVATFPGLRVLAWDQKTLYAGRGYTLLRDMPDGPETGWEEVGYFSPARWRTVSASFRLTYRLVRDGFHALAALPSGHLIAAVPGAIVTLAPGETEFRVSHKLLRGSRPLHIATTPNGRVFWGEYFNNANRDEVHIYASEDRGSTWQVAYTFAKRSIRHVHNVVYDRWQDCLWVLTGDNGAECRIVRATCDFRNVEVVLSRNQQARTAAMVPTEAGLYFSSDTPLERNFIYLLDRNGHLERLANIGSSSIYGCRVGDSTFFSTMAEPSEVNPTDHVSLYGSADGVYWAPLGDWSKDRWPMKFFQYGNVFLPDGANTTDLLALTTIAVADSDLETSLWQVTTT
jgi:hypothetical protein